MSNEANANQQPSIDKWEHGEWVQLNVGLVRHQGDALSSARVLFTRIASLVNYWQSHGLLRWFFFMRKPPDVRLRFFTKVDQQQAIAEISDIMSLLQQENYINVFFFSEYQPETERFGGIEAMQWVHQHFDIDTSLWLILDYLHQNHLSVVPKDVLLPTLLHDLFKRVMPNQISVLAAWRSLAALIPTPPETTISTVEVLSIEALYQSHSVAKKEADVLERYTIANGILAQKLVNLQDMGQLTQPLTDILAAVAMFTFHRHGFDWQRSGRLIPAIIWTLEDREN
ncbi:thiopeptide-type bacteriocin biosynthesis protein [Anabaena sp. UHCC 0399]|uniref:thiopeptide-type bacteriocin biosynthesis protein n=1 Tax=Anabaena sp. UHCC 0399 TaxID=3110238 RepID=UPI002B211488|nr:thiopeptide-type bacteriocin biosynthesis protein [Anabaena sp. UHCC 0399]MEA5568496.1 thiopeptide-type bacteriocin biosynthesis protein [Anabaena sp. UHCC 0399]